jgi:hypothetical protein
VDAELNPNLILMLGRHSGLDPAADTRHIEIAWLLGGGHAKRS